MKKSQISYALVNLVVLLVTAGIFCQEYYAKGYLFESQTGFQIMLLLFAALIVHALKATRAYLILYGSEVSWIKNLKVYFKITPVSVVLPFKLGEFFRMYCYGKTLGNYLKGIIIVLLDRFMDTTALVTMVVCVKIFVGGSVDAFTYFLIVFLALILLVYFAFPGVHRFWKRYFLKAKGTENRLAALKMLDKANLIYKETKAVSVGRGFLLYILSLVAWAVEIGSVVALVGIAKGSEFAQAISNYLTSATGITQTDAMSRFVFVSVVIMAVGYPVVKIGQISFRKKGVK